MRQLEGRDGIEHRLFRLVMDRARQLLVERGMPPESSSTPFFTTPQEEKRAHALAVIAACRELTVSLDRRTDDAADHALRSKATFAEIGVAHGVTRQAARQAHLRRARRRADALRQQPRVRRDHEDESDWQYQRDLERQEREQRWPPRAWRYRAPTGLRTVTLVDGPAASRTERVPVGDDAFTFIDHYEVFGPRHDRYARYTAVSPASDQYRFTGEYFVRWS